ncbi:glycosyl-transferase for dystroglycan-domain-containing protein [Choanephora cucurbitarum]|nr:glycosyl-transferase for dystroglycan-domain-containing protein [Choanephora cucurbitarum]
MPFDSLPKSFGRAFKFVVLVYAAVCAVYIAIQFFGFTDSQHARSRRSLVASDQDRLFVAPLSQEELEEDELQDSSHIVYFDQVYRSVSSYEDNMQAGNNAIMQSKIYASSMGPSNVMPYYLRADQEFDEQDISISTIVTVDRFPVLSRLASRYKGPISAAIHITDDESKEHTVEQLHQTIQNNPDMKRYVDIHLIVDKFDRQFNMWRNAAKLYARTDYIMMLDIDFYLCTDFRKKILENPNLLQMLQQGHTALVVPAFEYLAQSDGFDSTHFPKDKEALLKEVFDDAKLDMFHRDWQGGHASTNYPKWYLADKPYRVEDYNFSYEPYVIYKRSNSPWCDERFIGYGANKAACLYEVYLSGIDYYVLPDDFIIHQSHEYPETTRKRERLFNRKVYTNFREELCLRYARQFIATGEWNTSISNNLRSECQKIRGFANIIATINQ